MIKVLNRELLIPNNERYLGTEYDTYSAVRLFQLDRVNSDGVDIADLLFKLDLKYPEDRTIYTLTSSTDITSGQVYVNKVSFLKQKKTAGTYEFLYNGTAWSLSGTAVTLSDYGISIVTGTAASGNKITVILATSTEQYDVVNLTKEVTDDQIKLQWDVTENQLAIPGTVYIQIRAVNDDADVKWASFTSAMFVEDAINAGTHINSISELEELELVLNAELEQIADYGTLAEMWARGSHDASQTPSSTNNAKYFSEQSASSATAAAGSATSASGYSTAASGSATSAAGSATLAQSWAVGSTGTRTGEDTNNASYYATQAAAQVTLAEAQVDLAEAQVALATTQAGNASNSAIAAAASAAEAESYTGTFIQCDRSQSLNETQKAQARSNMGVGSGTGDMIASTYDPNSHASDIFAYADSSSSSAVSTHNSSSAAHSSLFSAKADASALTSHTGNTSNPHNVTAAQVGLGNVNNTSDANKPISTATQTALNAKADIVKQTSISLAVAGWSGSSSPYSQTVTISGTDANSKVDLQPSSTVIAQLVDDGVLGLYVENNNGTLTCYAVGEKPTAALTIQATYYEVTA